MDRLVPGLGLGNHLDRRRAGRLYDDWLRFLPVHSGASPDRAVPDTPVTNEDGDTNIPGGDFQCRCTAEPNLDDLAL